MALDKCSDCDGEISDAAFVCPHCGRPMLQSAHGTRHRRNWELGAVIAALIGLLALFVSGYTAFVQREQVSAQVWPHLLIGYSDPARELAVFNKGVGPALIKSVEITVDGKPQRNWTAVFDALGVKGSSEISTLHGNVLSPAETLNFMSLPTQVEYQQFRALAAGHLKMKVCYCSTLGECWMAEYPHAIRLTLTDKPVAECPRLTPDVVFRD